MLSVFLENRNELPVFHSLFNKITEKNSALKKATNPYTTPVFCLYDFPSYLIPNYNESKWAVKTVNSFEGSMIILKNYKDTTDYLNTNFSSSRRSKFKTYRRRLEKVFSISYKAYYGNISENEFNTLFSEFHKLIEKRFVEKKIKNYDLTRWEVYTKIALPLIRNKEAVLFVIYDKNKPISICLNLIRDEVIYGYVRAYDIDYSKYYLGFTDFIKQLEWCYDNNIKVFDLLKGKYEYKSRLIDDNYIFQKHIIYQKNNFWAKLRGISLFLKISSFYKIIGILKKLKFDYLYHLILKYKYRNTVTSNKLHYLLEQLNNPTIITQTRQIDFTNERYNFLKRPVYDALYKVQEELDCIEVHQHLSDKNAYFIKSSNTITKITLS
ncbi:GNAT family N-acetyltransferase [Hyunsoonleella ulvae]|uniref:GNAT family N-acetyltransferase n=1 Tax=Hyunsoonleella ulvae TaxID=2799948 RepID=UPI0019398073|nr:GNAT family N-acetyltransferase [Hyunsoonleella ulvae]